MIRESQVHIHIRSDEGVFADSPCSRILWSNHIYNTSGALSIQDLPFWSQWHPCHFSGSMDRVLWPHQEYAVAYLDDVVVFTGTWKEHVLPWIRAILQSLWAAGLMANPMKCQLGCQHNWFLWYALRNGEIRSPIEKIKNIGGISYT